MTDTGEAPQADTVSGHLVETQRELRGHRFHPRPGTVPAVYATKEIELDEKVLHQRYWIGSCQWWIAEYDPATGLAYGYACLGDPANAEWGYLDLADLEALNHGGRIVRRDLHWPPTRARDARLPGT